MNLFPTTGIFSLRPQEQSCLLHTTYPSSTIWQSQSRYQPFQTQRTRRCHSSSEFLFPLEFRTEISHRLVSSIRKSSPSKQKKSERSFKIHRKLLASVCTTVTSALDKFQEGQNGSYTFEDTSEGTLARFIEWVYTRGYADVIESTEPAEQKTKKLEDESKGEQKIMTTAQLALTTVNHPLLVHINLYIFSSIYMIPDFCDFVFDKITTCLEELDKPDTLDTQLAVISALRLAFSKLPPHDRLFELDGSVCCVLH